MTEKVNYNAMPGLLRWLANLGMTTRYVKNLNIHRTENFVYVTLCLDIDPDYYYQITFTPEEFYGTSDLIEKAIRPSAKEFDLSV